MADKQDIEYFLAEAHSLSKTFLADLDNRPAAVVESSTPTLAFNEEGYGNSEAIALLRNKVMPYLSASAGARYWGFVTGGANPAALFADILVSTFDQNVSKDGDSIASAVERQTLEWLKALFHLPDDFNGIVTTGATSANFLAAVFARQFAGKQQQIDVALDGMSQLSVEIFSACPHASMIKSLGLAGFGQKQITQVNTLANSEQMDSSHLASLLASSKATSKIVIASAATVTATSFDDLESIASICTPHNAWLHVDAAFGLFERLVNGKNGLSKGIEAADSITLDFHKWLNVPYDAGAIFTRHQKLMVQSCNVDAPYLVNTSSEPDFLALGVENSRRFRALPIWFTLLTYGKNGIRQWVERNMRHAKSLAEWLANEADFELALPCQLNVVVFRPNLPHLSETEGDQFTSTLLQEINREGTIFLSPGVWQGKKVIRAALCNWQTEDKDLELAKNSLTACLARVKDSM